MVNMVYMVYILNVRKLFTVWMGKTEEGYFGNGSMKIWSSSYELQSAWTIFASEFCTIVVVQL